MPRSIPHYRAFLSFSFLICIAISVLLLFPSSALAWETPVNKVHDGDTIEVYRKGRDVDVRFYGIDCPEKDQPYGMKAKKYVSKMCNDRTFNVEASSQYQYGRVIGLVYVD